MKRATPFVLLLALTLVALAMPNRAYAVSGSVVISQVYGAGGNSGATWRYDYVELYNRSSSPVSLAGWSLQYASATGFSWGSANVALSGTVAAHGYYLVQLGSGGTAGALLPTADETGSPAVNMSATTGKIALCSSTTALTGNCPVGSLIVDFVGYGATADCREGSANAPAPSATNSINRICGFTDHNKDTDQNSTDFMAIAASPRNSSSPDITCSPTPTLNSTWGSLKVIYR